MRALTRADGPLIERLFGTHGACGGCWCMLWRAPYGGARFAADQGEPNRRALLDGIAAGRVHGVLALRDGAPVGWASVGPKADFPYFARSRVLHDPAPDPRTWSVTCLFVPARERGAGIATALLRGAVALARRAGAARLEGYPVEPRAGRVPAAFAWTGVPALFAAVGFRPAPRPPGARAIWVRSLAPRG